MGKFASFYPHRFLTKALTLTWKLYDSFTGDSQKMYQGLAFISDTQHMVS